MLTLRMLRVQWEKPGYGLATRAVGAVGRAWIVVYPKKTSLFFGDNARMSFSDCESGVSA